MKSTPLSKLPANHAAVTSFTQALGLGGKAPVEKTPNSIPKVRPPWHHIDDGHPIPPHIPLALWDGLNMRAGIWTKRIGTDGGFATLVMKQNRRGTTTKLTLIEGVRCWLRIPDIIQNLKLTKS